MAIQEAMVQLGPNGRVEQERMTSGNSFVDFLRANTDQFNGYAEIDREHRLTQKAWRAEFNVVFSKYEESVRRHNFLNPSKTQGNKVFPAITDKKIQRVRSFWQDRVFKGIVNQAPGTEDNARSINEHLHPGMVESDLETGQSLDDLGNSYTEVIMPIQEEMQKAGSVLMEEVDKFIQSNYQGLIDMWGFYSSPKHAALGQAIFPFFKRLAEINHQDHRKGDKGYLGRVKDHWSNIAKDKYDSVVFGRFWDKITTSNAVNDIGIIDWVNFSALVEKATRDETQLTIPTNDDIKTAIGRVPFGSWPKQLRDAYSSFASKDLSYLIENIRAKWGEMYLRAGSEDRFVETSQVEPVSKKSHKNRQPGLVSNGHEPSAPPREETERSILAGVLKPAIDGNTHYTAPFPADLLDSQISKLADKGVTPQMKQDLIKVLKSMGNSSLVYGPVCVNLARAFDIRVDGKERRLKRLDPRGIRGLTFQDSETARSRVIFTIIKGEVFIEGVYPTHQEFDKRVKNSYR